MNLRLLWKRHKTKSLGGLMVVFGAIQSNITAIQDHISKRAYGFVIIGLGVMVALLGFLNSQHDPDPDH